MDNLNWLVVCTVKPSKFEEEYKQVIAVFENPINAEGFINLVIPEETRSRFCIEHK